MNDIAVIAVFLLCLTSEGVQKFLLTKPMQFLGKISYMFYLIHLTFIHTMMYKLVNLMSNYNINVNLKDQDPNGGQGRYLTRNMAAIVALIITTPFVIAISAFLEKCVDSPAKNLANEIDQNLRVARPRDSDGQPK